MTTVTDNNKPTGQPRPAGMKSLKKTEEEKLFVVRFYLQFFFLSLFPPLFPLLICF